MHASPPARADPGIFGRARTHLGGTAAPPDVGGAAVDEAVAAADVAAPVAARVPARHVHQRRHEPGHSHLRAISILVFADSEGN